MRSFQRPKSGKHEDVNAARHVPRNNPSDITHFHTCHTGDISIDSAGSVVSADAIHEEHYFSEYSSVQEKRETGFSRT